MNPTDSRYRIGLGLPYTEESMGCRRTRSRIVAWLDQELPTIEAHRIEDHLAECAACQSHASLLQATQPVPTTRPDQLNEEPRLDDLLEGVLTRYDQLDAQGLAFHRQRWWPTEVRLGAVHVVAYAAVLLTAIGWAWVSHLEAQAAVAAKDRALQDLAQRHPAGTASEAEATPVAPVLQPTPLWTTAGTLERPDLGRSATTPTFRTVATTPYRGTF